MHYGFPCGLQRLRIIVGPHVERERRPLYVRTREHHNDRVLPANCCTVSYSVLAVVMINDLIDGSVVAVCSRGDRYSEHMPPSSALVPERIASDDGKCAWTKRCGRFQLIGSAPVRLDESRTDINGER